MKNPIFASVALAAVLLFSGSANAAVFNFEVLYSGGGNAVLSPGSDPMIGTTLTDGDGFLYTLSANGDGYWTSLNGGDNFPVIGLPVNESADRNVDFTLTLKNNGVTVFTFSDLTTNSSVHIGTNTVNVTQGLVFDQWVLALDLLSGGASTLSDTLPIFGAPEENRFYPGTFSYSTGAIPEPATWGLMIGGFGLAGTALRRRRIAPVTLQS